MSFFEEKYTETFLPSNEINKDLELKRTILHRVYEFRETKFRFSFNAALCNDVDHMVVLAFMDHWVNATKMKKELIMKNAFSIFKDSSEMEKEDVKPNTTYAYSVGCYTNGVTSQDSVVRLGYSMMNAHTFVTVTQSGAVISRLKDDDFSTVCSITWNNPIPRYIVLFSTEVQHCPTFISAVDENFDVWLRHKKIDVTGISKPPPKDTTVFRDVILSCVAIIFYYYFLTSLILPAYFNFMMPVARHEPIVIARSDEKSAVQLKATTGKINDNNNNDDNNDNNEKDYNNIEVSKLD